MNQPLLEFIEIFFKSLWAHFTFPFLSKDEKLRYYKRKEICDLCPLKSGNICNSNYGVSMKGDMFASRDELEINGQHLINESYYYRKKLFILGCGCILPLKQKSKNKCPRWNT